MFSTDSSVDSGGGTHHHRGSHSNLSYGSNRFYQQYKVPPCNIPGLRTFDNHHAGVPASCSTQSTPTSDEGNSPTELNTYKRLIEKPPLVKRIPISSGKELYHEDGFPLVRPTPEGCISLQKETTTTTISVTDGKYPTNSLNISSKQMDLFNHRVASSSKFSTSLTSNRLKSISGSSNSCSTSDTTSSSSGHTDEGGSSNRSSIASTSSPSTLLMSHSPLLTPPPSTPLPLPPERADSLKHKEENELRNAPWFQAGIPREITLEVLSQEPIGAFMVRESTTKPGCFALSVRVPREFQLRGIAHYLILRTNKGYKIKGFTKEFSTLTALITHHSVMQELLPCPLSLSRYNPCFTKSDTRKDFEDIDADPDYNTLADFRKMMADLNV